MQCTHDHDHDTNSDNGKTRAAAKSDLHVIIHKNLKLKYLAYGLYMLFARTVLMSVSPRQ